MIIRLGIVGAIIGTLFYFFFELMMFLLSVAIAFALFVAGVVLISLTWAWFIAPFNEDSPFHEGYKERKKKRELKKSKPKPIDQDLLNRVCFEYDLTPEDAYTKFGRTNGALRNALKGVDNQSATN